MATIKENVNKLTDAVVREMDKPGSTFLFDLRRVAAAAIREGAGSPEWEVVMRIFADNSEQLALLTAKDPLVPPLLGREYAVEISAYLAGGIICTSETTVHLPHRIEAIIDKNLSAEVEPGFAKPFPIPPA